MLKRTLVLWSLVLGLGCPILAQASVPTPKTSGKEVSGAGKTSPARSVHSSPSSRSARKAKAPAKRVNLNTASAEELATLPGVGPGVAKQILSWRKEHGRFAKAEDVMAVRGIGEKKFARMKDYLAVD